jgi:hypothetical protein
LRTLNPVRRYCSSKGSFGEIYPLLSTVYKVPRWSMSWNKSQESGSYYHPLDHYLSFFHKRFSLPVLLNVQTHFLSLPSSQQQQLKYEEILTAVEESLQQVLPVQFSQNFEESMEIYGTLLLESIFYPIFTYYQSRPFDNQSFDFRLPKQYFQLKRELIADEYQYVQIILDVLRTHCKGMTHHPAIEELEYQWSIYQLSLTRNASRGGGPGGPGMRNNGPPNDYYPSNAGNNPYMRNSGPPYSRPSKQYPPGNNMPPPQGFNRRNNMMMPPGPPPSAPPPVMHPSVPTSAASWEQQPNSQQQDGGPMTEFLSHLRKYNMDVIFPQSVHDKVCITFFFQSIFSCFSISFIDFSMFVCGF